MAVCGNCGSESARVRSRWGEKGVQLADECPSCAPAQFEKFTAPSDKKIWMGYEAHPNEYVQSADGGFDRKPEYRAEQEQRLTQETEDERIARERAEANKRATRRTDPMTPDETLQAIRKANLYAAMMQEQAEQDAKARQEAELLSWTQRAARA